jgi:hypothetical protein
VLLEDVARRLQDVLIQVANQVESLRQKFEEAPLTFGLEKRRNILKLPEVRTPEPEPKPVYDAAPAPPAPENPEPPEAAASSGAPGLV